MRTWILSIVVISLLATGCKGIECGEGTIERNGTCMPADETTSTARCGPFTELVGTECVPMFPPTVCDNGTTDPDPDPTTGVTTCIGTGGGGCGAPLACPTPAGGKQTICGQLYDFETNAAFSDGCGATGTKCSAATATGPCSLGIKAYDAIAFASNPSTAVPLAVGETYVDDCGRYRLADITVPGGPFIALGIDDADGGKAGPTGTTNTAGVALPKQADTSTRDFEAFVAPKSTTDKWTASGGPPISGGIYAMVFRANKTGLNNNPGVTVTGIAPSNVTYFQPAQTTRTDLMAGATTTGANGTGLVINAALGTFYSGTSTSLPMQCNYSAHQGASLPFILFIQILRPVDKFGMTCPL